MQLDAFHLPVDASEQLDSFHLPSTSIPVTSLASVQPMQPDAIHLHVGAVQPPALTAVEPDKPGTAPLPVFPLLPTDDEVRHRLTRLAANEQQLEGGKQQVAAGHQQRHDNILETAADHINKGMLQGKCISLHTMFFDAADLHPSLLLAALAMNTMQSAEKHKPISITLTAAAVQDIGARISKPFTLDCSVVAAPSAVKAEAPRTVEEVLAADLSGHHVYMHASFKNMPTLVQHYLNCKNTGNLSGVFVVTADLYRSRPDLFKSFKVLRVYDRYSPVNLRHWESAPATISRTQTKLYVLYDGVELNTPNPDLTVTPETSGDLHASTAAAPSHLNPHETDHPPVLINPPPLSSYFTAKVSGAVATVGIDSMCQGYGFIQPAFVERHSLRTVPVQTLKVQLGDGKTTTATSTACKVNVHLGSYHTAVWLLVMPIPQQCDVLLGDQFLVTNNAYPIPDRKCLVIQTAKRKHVVYNKEASIAKKRQDRTPSILLSSMQFKRQVKKGSAYELCYVQIDSDSSSSEQPIETALDQHDISGYDPEIADFVKQYPDVFPVLLKKAMLRDDMPEVIATPPASKPPNLPLRRVDPISRAEIENQVRELLEQGLIQPSNSPYGSPVLLVKKKDGTMRMCIDYRALNSITVKNAYPLPRIDDLLDRLQGAKFFSSLDLMSGYHQLALRDSDITKTAFKTHVGLFEYKVLCFGLTNAPSVFQAIMNKVFSKYPNVLNKFVLVYMDDILIYSQTKEEHLRHLKTVFDILREEQLSVKLKKCQFFKSEVKFLGHVISANGVKPDPDKVSAVELWPLPKTQTELKGFLGLTNYFRRFIKAYSHIAAPLVNLTRKSLGTSVILTTEAIHAFHALKAALVSAETLAIPDFTKPFKLVSDASHFGLGGVLMQCDQPVAYESKKFTSTEMNYSTTDRELYAVVHCLKKWKVYMIGNAENIIVTDHKPNTTIQTKSTEHLSPRQIRWIEFLQQFPCKWKYEKGESNIADPLSRFNTYLLAILRIEDDPTALFNENTLQLPKLLHSIAFSSKSDTYAQAHIEQLEQQHGVYFYKNRIYVPNVPDLRQHIIMLHHDTLFSGHMGKNHTLQALTRWFYWPNMHRDVTKYVAQCLVCQQAKPGKIIRQGLLHPLSVPDRPWWSISIDFITGLPVCKDGSDAILTIVDRLTRMVHLVPTLTTCDSIEFAQLMKQHVISKHGCPADIVSDRGSLFTGKFWTEVCHLLQMHMSMSTAFHPQSDGSTEIVNRMVEQVLRCHCMYQPQNWVENLCMVEFAINNSYQESLKHTPFFLNFGMHPATPVTIETIKLSKNPIAAKWTQDMMDTLNQAKLNLQQAKDRQKSYADQQRTDVSFQVGDTVLLATTNLQPKTGNRKLYPRFLGPFTITQVINDVAYRLDLPATMKIHPVFHVSLLKPYSADGTVQPPPTVEVDNVEEYEVESILQHRFKKSGNRPREEFLVKWKGYGFEHCTWEPLENLTNCPDILAEFRRSNKSPAALPPAPKQPSTAPSTSSSRRKRRRPQS